jgi:hypothetical protein
MKKLIVSAIMTASVLFTAAAFAAPPARKAPSSACAHCTMNQRGMAQQQARAGLYGQAQYHCHHGTIATNVRWGNAKKPCPHCSHVS